MARANEELCLLIQVESKAALDNLDAICMLRVSMGYLSARRPLRIIGLS
jgi:hypothetical protein